jgi:hydroxymethylpyrimidine pyrophosphatase-like HAD family hydrolase
MGVLMKLIPGWKSRKAYYIAVDFDGTLADDKFPEIGQLKLSTIKKLKQKEEKLKAIGKELRLILWTCRGSHSLIEAVAFCRDNDINIYAINYNPDFQTGSTKIYADEYWDDKAIRIGGNDEA